MKRKAILTILTVLACLFSFSIPAWAGNSAVYEAIPIYRGYDGNHSYFSYPLPFEEYLKASSNHLDDGIAGYIAPDPIPGTVPIYVMKYNWDTYLAPGDDVRDALIIKYGYYDAGILGYAVPASDNSMGDKKINLWFKGGSKQDHYYDDEPKYIPNYTYEGTPFRVWNVGTTLQEIDIVTPTEGAVLKSGQTTVIQWTSLIDQGEVTLSYSTNKNIGPWTTIAAGLPANGSYSWNVPSAAIGNDVAINIEWRYNSQYGSAIRYKYVSPLTVSGIKPSIGLAIKPISIEIIPYAPSNLIVQTDMIKRNVSLSWQDNSDTETGFIIEREYRGQFAPLSQVAANTKTYTDTSVAEGVKYTYRVKASGSIAGSAYSNEATGGYSEINFAIPGFEKFVPQAPQNLTATAEAELRSAKLAWSAGGGAISGYKVERKKGSAGEWEIVEKVNSSTTAYTDTGLNVSETYTYRVRSYDTLFTSDSSNEASVTLPSAPQVQNPQENNNNTNTNTNTNPNPDPGYANSMVFNIGAQNYNVNGQAQNMDVSPVVLNGRTMLPIRFVTTPMGAVLVWDGNENKVTISKGGTTIELWIDNNTAKVNGTSILIDPENPSVMPVLINDRTMLPLRFITEKLGCGVQWDDATQSVTISY